jgi:hypothetical protein
MNSDDVEITELELAPSKNVFTPVKEEVVKKESGDDPTRRRSTKLGGMTTLGLNESLI